MGKFFSKQKIHWSDRAFLLSVISSFILLSLSVIVNHFANNYVIKMAKNSVTDIILNNTRVFDVENILIYGSIAIMAFTVIILIMQPQRIPFTVKSIALFIFVRTVFISVTHIGQFYPQIQIDGGKILDFLGMGNQGGLFFSGHTGMPFLLMLVFWKDTKLRIVYLLTSLVFGTCVLLGHIHYSIDVLGAFFITPTIFSLSKTIFNFDYLSLYRGIVGNSGQTEII